MKYTTRIEIKERHTGKVLYADLIGADLRNTRLQNANIENSLLEYKDKSEKRYCG